MPALDGVLTFDSAPRPFVVTDLGGSIQLVNRAAASLLRAAPEALVGKPLAVYVALNDRPRFRERLHAVSHAADALPPLELSLTLAPRGGDAVVGAATVTRTMDPRGAGTLLWMLPADVDRGAHRASSPTGDPVADEHDEGAATQAAAANPETLCELRRLNEELREANREALALLHREQRLRRALERAEGAKVHFFTVLSHELRTPVQAILGYTELLVRDLGEAMTPSRQNFLRRMQQSEQHLLGLVSNVLDYERTTRGNPVAVEVTPVTVREVLDVIEVMVNGLAADKVQTLDITCADPALTAPGDRAMMQQILVNLVHNAIKFTPRGGRIAVDARCRGNGTVAISVRDTGRGIPAGKLEQIFDPFAQAAADDMRHGSGLGLAISRNLARALAGELVAENEADAGARFTLTLRSAPAPAETHPPVSPPE